jgi:hypothetical protein
MKNIIAYLKVSAASGLNPFLFKALPELSAFKNNPPASGHMLENPWQRVGEPF